MPTAMDPAELTDGSVKALWYCPPNEGRKPVVLLEMPGGPKRFRRVWLDEPANTDDWTWIIPDDAVRIA